MLQYLKRWYLPAVSAFTISAIFATSTTAFAELPGESNRYTEEIVNGQQLASSSSYSEARTVTGGVCLRVWRGLNNQVMMAFLNNGPVFTLGATVTTVAPVVVPYGPNNYMVFHTGTNGNIYTTEVAPAPPSWNGDTSGLWPHVWTPVPGQTTNMAVSVTQFDAVDGALYMVYRGSGTDTRVFGTWFDGSWHAPSNIGGGLGLSSPSITTNLASDTLWVTVQGDDGAVWVTHQAIGESGWPA